MNYRPISRERAGNQAIMHMYSNYHDKQAIGSGNSFFVFLLLACIPALIHQGIATNNTASKDSAKIAAASHVAVANNSQQ